LQHKGDLMTAYAYNNNLLVAENDEVVRGQKIAIMGKLHDQALLYFEVRRDGQSVDPVAYLPTQ
jgi:lipoprotein NlpD